MKLALWFAFIGFSNALFAAQCAWNDGWTWGELRTVEKGTTTQVTLKGSQLSALAKFVDLKGDAWTVVAGARFEIPSGQSELHACVPAQILAGNDSVLATRRLNLTYRISHEGQNTLVRFVVDGVLDETLLFEDGDCQ